MIHCILALRVNSTNDETPVPGDHISCMRYVQSTLPIALARPYVINLIPEKTKVGIMCSLTKEGSYVT
jgi:hypothetical protein